MPCDPNAAAEATAANAAAEANVAEVALVKASTAEATEPMMSKPKKTTQQAHQDGRNDKTKAGPIGGKEIGAT